MIDEHLNSQNIQDSGFSANVNNEGSRLLNKNGTVNIERTGLSFFNRFSLYHSFITMNWMVFFLMLFAFFFGINMAFAILYTAFGIDGLSGDVPTTYFNQFLKAFYFSAQTITTVGYGAVSPVRTPHLIISSFEAFIGLLSFAMSTGLLYGRFSRPRAKMLFTENALIAPFAPTGKGLMIRLANKKDSLLVNAQANMFLSWIGTTVNGEQKRKYQNLPLEYDRINMLASSWTLVHPINSESPLYNWKKIDFEKNKVEVIVQINAYDETYSQVVHDRTSYRATEIVMDAKFESVLGHNDSGQAIIEFDKFNRYTHVKH